MAHDLSKVHEAINRAEGVAIGIGALVALLASARDADMPKGKALCELIEPLQKTLDEAVRMAEEGLAK